MLQTIVLTVIGNDRPGLVDVLSGCIAEHGGNWEESRMAHLASKFAGLVLVRVSTAKADALLRALNQLETQGLMHITAERAGSGTEPADTSVLQLELTGQDHPGIVHDVAHALASRGVSIDEFETETRAASMSGGSLFFARANLSVPQTMPIEDLREALESLADELMVDVDLDRVDPKADGA